ncbi:hypothetical protein BDZ97DRAFT_1934993 [Flammula alnicola]|nr:hypothetical protein BDZ97DRAFT_1934993 [Flammula alnicola]
MQRIESYDSIHSILCPLFSLPTRPAHRSDEGTRLVVSVTPGASAAAAACRHLSPPTTQGPTPPIPSSKEVPEHGDAKYKAMRGDDECYFVVSLDSNIVSCRRCSNPCFRTSPPRPPPIATPVAASAHDATTTASARDDATTASAARLQRQRQGGSQMRRRRRDGRSGSTTAAARIRRRQQLGAAAAVHHCCCSYMTPASGNSGSSTTATAARIRTQRQRRGGRSNGRTTAAAARMRIRRRGGGSNSSATAAAAPIRIRRPTRRWEQQQLHDGGCCSYTATATRREEQQQQRPVLLLVYGDDEDEQQQHPLLLLRYGGSTSMMAAAGIRRRRQGGTSSSSTTAAAARRLDVVGDSGSTTAAAARIGADDDEVTTAARRLLLLGWATTVARWLPLGYGVDEMEAAAAARPLLPLSAPPQIGMSSKAMLVNPPVPALPEARKWWGQIFSRAQKRPQRQAAPKIQCWTSFPAMLTSVYHHPPQQQAPKPSLAPRQPVGIMLHSVGQLPKGVVSLVDVHSLLAGSPGIIHDTGTYRCTRTNMRSGRGPFAPDNVRTLAGVFSALVSRGITFGTEFSRRGRSLFTSPDDFRAACRDTGRRDPQYFCNPSAYGRYNPRRSTSFVDDYWKLLQIHRWPALDDAGLIPFMVCFRFFKPANKKSRFPEIGDLTAYLLTADYVYAGVVAKPTLEEMGTIIHIINKGAVKALETVGLLSTRLTTQGGNRVTSTVEECTEAFRRSHDLVASSAPEQRRAAVGLDYIVTENTLSTLYHVTKRERIYTNNGAITNTTGGALSIEDKVKAALYPEPINNAHGKPFVTSRKMLKNLRAAIHVLQDPRHKLHYLLDSPCHRRPNGPQNENTPVASSSGNATTRMVKPAPASSLQFINYTPAGEANAGTTDEGVLSCHLNSSIPTSVAACSVAYSPSYRIHAIFKPAATLFEHRKGMSALHTNVVANSTLARLPIPPSAQANQRQNSAQTATAPPLTPHTQTNERGDNAPQLGEQQHEVHPEVDEDLEQLFNVYQAANDGIPEHAAEDDDMQENEPHLRQQGLPAQPVQRRQRRRGRHNLCLAARQPYQDPPRRHDLGRMDIPCPKCSALHWIDESFSESSRRNPRFGTCCMDGKVHLPPLEAPPEPLQHLLTSQDRDAAKFRDHKEQETRIVTPRPLWHPPLRRRRHSPSQPSQLFK